MSVCALNKSNTAEGTCLNDAQIKIISKYAKADTIKDIKKETKCDDDICILDAINIPLQIKEQIKRESLKAPAGGFDHNYWLNNTEIDTIMSQFRIQFDGFAHGWIHMSDLVAFAPSNIKTFDYDVFDARETDFASELKYSFIQRGIIKDDTFKYTPKLSTYKNKPLTAYGIVCNTDSSKGSGQHWFAIFISTDQYDPDNSSKPWIRIECFNSAGGGSDNQAFDKFWNEQAIQISKATGLKCTYDTITTIQHQRSDTGNCGSYSLFYIYARLRGEHPSEFNNPRRIIKDEEMKRFRKVCFREDKDDPLVV